MCKTNQRLVLWLLVLCATNDGCSKAPVATQQSPSPSDKKATTSQTVGTTIPDDLSLTADDYIRLGLPAHDRTWSGNDMGRAAMVLESLAEKDPRQLPRYHSRQSGEVFARMTAAQNLELLRNRSLPVEARLPEALDLVDASNRVMKLYLATFVRKVTGDSEMVELMGAQLRSTVVILELVDEFLPTLDKNDPSYQVRMSGLKQMRQGLATVVAGCLQTLTEKGAYRNSELVRLLDYMQETFPAVVPQLPPGSRMEIMVRLETMAKDPTLKEFAHTLQELYEKVRNSENKNRAP